VIAAFDPAFSVQIVSVFGAVLQTPTVDDAVSARIAALLQRFAHRSDEPTRKQTSTSKRAQAKRNQHNESKLAQASQTSTSTIAHAN
jgi:hypothetical protein